MSDTCHKCSVDLWANCIFVLAVFAVQICLWCLGKLQICCDCFLCERRIEEMWRRKILESAVWRQRIPKTSSASYTLDNQALTSSEDATASVFWNCESPVNGGIFYFGRIKSLLRRGRCWMCNYILKIFKQTSTIIKMLRLQHLKLKREKQGKTQRCLTDWCTR